MKKMLLLKYALTSLMLVAGFSGFIFAQSLKISPEELELTVGDTVELTATYIDTNENEIDTSAIWTVAPHQLATVNNKGQLVAKSEGEGRVIATLNELSDTIEITVEAPDDDPEFLLPAVMIAQGDMEMYVGDTLQYSVIYIDTNEVEIDTNGVWNLRPDSLGTLDSTSGQFIADRPGEGMIEVYVGDLMAWVYVSVFPAGNLEDPEDPEKYCDFILMPKDTIIAIGDQIQYTVYEKAENDSCGPQMDTTFTWSLEGMSIGTIDQSGLLDVSATGYALVKVELGDMSPSALVIVQDSTLDDTLNNITITRDSPNPSGYSIMRELSEGEIWTMGGLPHPMNVLNGSQVYFPIGSLTEDIRIHISLPQFAEIRGDSVGWGHEGVLAGVDFTVMVNDSIQQPYYFETPLIVSMVYKRGLLDKLGIDPATLGLYFVIEGGDTLEFNGMGISETVVDENFNRIFSGVIHFSTLAVMGDEGTVTNIEHDAYIPSAYALEQNYPNPFNPITSLRYTLPEAQKVAVSIYDLAGRRVETLLSAYQQAGTYELKWNASHYSSGVYFYRLEAGDFVETKKMVLMK